MFLGLAAAPGNAVAADGEADPSSLKGLVIAYGVADVPVDILAVVDVSDSMGKGDPPVWPSVVAGYRQLVDAASDSDRIGLITFNEQATTKLLFEKMDSEKSRDLAKSRLPETRPKGHGTDIGAALNTALERLRDPGASTIQTVAVITDGKNNPTKAKFADAYGPEWQRMRKEADELQSADDGNLTVYGWGVGPKGTTDRGLVADVFTDAQTVDIDPSQVKTLVAGLAADAQRARVRPKVAADLAAQPTAELEVGELDATTEGTLTISNPRTALTTVVDLAGMDVRDEAGNPVSVDLATQRLTLAPGQSEQLPVVLNPVDADHGLTLGRHEQSQTWTVQVNGTTALRPAVTTLLTKELGTTAKQAEGELVTTTPTVVASQSYGISWALFFALLAAVLLMIAVAIRVGWWAFIPPKLVGEVQRLDPDDEYRTVLSLTGKKEARLPGNSVDIGESSDGLRIFTKPRSRAGAVYVQATGGSPRVNDRLLTRKATRIAGMPSITMGRLTLRYRRDSSKK